MDTVDPGAETRVAPPGESPAQAELRTFLFADVRGYSRFTQERGDEAAARLVRKFERITRDTVPVRGGQVLEMRGDEALVVFASARQALRAAVDLQAQYQRETGIDPGLPLHVGIGIEAGEAVPVDGGYRGEALNLAARLCNLAGPGEILATEGVVYLGRRVQGVSYADRGDVPLKGFGDRVKVIRVMAAPSGQTRTEPASADIPSVDHVEPSVPIGGFLGALPSGPLVGREEEWQRIVTLMESVMQGTGRLVLLSGEPGIGKTRLAQEVTLKARHWGFLVATGRCYEPEQNVPYYPFLEALATLYERCHPSVRGEIPRRWPYLGRLLPDQVGIIPASAPGDEDQFLLFRAVTGFIEAIAETQPVALLLDDLHWADDASLRLLQHLARYTRGYRVLLFGAYRDVEVHRQHPLETVLLDLAREQVVDEVEVRRLNLAATRALIAEILGDKEDLEKLAELIYRRSDGNAFFIQEMLHALVERGDIYRENDRWEGGVISEMEVPKSIRSVIGQRLSRLEEGSQEILREASVLGQAFSFDDLAALKSFVPPVRAGAPPASGSTEDSVEGALEQALLAGLVRQLGGETYAFNHALTQQALYAELSPRRRKRLHLAAGRALERLPDRERERRAGEMAWHFLEGDDPEQALRYAVLAGTQAEQVFANREAERQYRTALELARELGNGQCEVEALERLAGVLIIGARYDRALEALEEAAALYGEAGNREGEARVVAQIGHVHFMQGTTDEGIARLQPLIETLEAAGAAPGALASLWAALAQLYSDAGEYEKQLKAAERALELVATVVLDPAGSGPGTTVWPPAAYQRLVLGAEVTRGDALWRLGQQDAALQAMEELIPRAEAAADLDNLARALGNAATYYAGRGELAKDRFYLERMLGVAERRGDRGQMILASMALSTNAFQLGDWTQADAHLTRAEQIVQALGNNHLAIWPLVSRAWFSLRRGDLTGAEQRAQQALGLLGGPGDAPWRRNLSRLLAERAILAGHPKEAMERLEQGKEEGSWKRDPGFLQTLAWAHLALNQTDQARTLADQAVAQARLRNRTPELAQALTVYGTTVGAAGDTAEADRLLDEALTLAHGVPLPFDEARALYESGRVLTARGEREPGQRRLTEALTIFERLGAEVDAQRARDALEHIPEST